MQKPVRLPFQKCSNFYTLKFVDDIGSSGQSYKHSIILNYNSRAGITRNLHSVQNYSRNIQSHRIGYKNGREKSCVKSSEFLIRHTI